VALEQQPLQHLLDAKAVYFASRTPRATFSKSQYNAMFWVVDVAFMVPPMAEIPIFAADRA